jgi:hypothetical protein
MNMSMNTIARGIKYVPRTKYTNWVTVNPAGVAQFAVLFAPLEKKSQLRNLNGQENDVN